MIEFCHTNRSFLISGKNFSYVLRVTQTGYLQHVYFGAKVTQKDLPYLAAYYADDLAPKACNNNYELMSDCIGMEMGSFGRGDFRQATAIIKRADGARMSRFSYVRHTICKGAVLLDGMPCARKADETLTVTLKDDFSDTEIDLNYSVSQDSDVLVRNAVYRNTGKEAAYLERAFSFCTDLPRDEYRLLRLAGRHNRERTPFVQQVVQGGIRVESSRGHSSHQLNPFVSLLRGNCDEVQGECFGFALIYSGSFALTAEMNNDESIRIQGGINDYTFGWRLNAGEAFVTPQAALCYSAEGLGGLSRAYADFWRAYIIDPRRANMRRPIVVNNWEATYFDFDTQKLCALIDEAAPLGIDTFVLDDGWFGRRDNDQSGLGDWFVNEKKLPGGLKPIIDHCKEKGLKFGIWFEPEMVSEDSCLFRAHPDWALMKQGQPPMRSRNQLQLDFSKREVVDYIHDVLCDILKHNDISYVKWDKNRDFSEYYSDALGYEGQGELCHRYMLGVYDLAQRLTSEFPDVFFEGCAGGGGRFDGGMLYYFPQIWTSDDTDGLERTKIQWGTSIVYPLSAMSCHVSACPNHQTGRVTPLATRGAIASLGATGYELDLCKLSAEEKEQIKGQIQAYRQIDELILSGDLYRIFDPFGTNCFCVMVVSKDKAEAYVVGERFRKEPNEYNALLRLRGLDDGKLYRIEELNVTAGGKALGALGVIAPHLADCGSWTWHIKEVK